MLSCMLVKTQYVAFKSRRKKNLDFCLIDRVNTYCMIRRYTLIQVIYKDHPDKNKKNKKKIRRN